LQMAPKIKTLTSNSFSGYVPIAMRINKVCKSESSVRKCCISNVSRKQNRKFIFCCSILKQWLSLRRKGARGLVRVRIRAGVSVNTFSIKRVFEQV